MLGLAFGSFFNVVALRVPQKKSIIKPASSCSACGRVLQIRDLMPVISWCIRGGKCGYCRQRISPIYPVAELLTGILFVGVVYRYGYSWETIIGLLLVSLSVIISVSDIVYMTIPNVILVALAVPIVAITLLFDWRQLGNHLLGAVAGGGVLLVVAVLSRGGMGMGDVKLFTLAGFIAGFPYVVLALLMACLAGVLVGVVLLAGKLITRRQPIPFAPFLLLGTWIAQLFGEQIFALYSSIIA